jgi:hypothetical protein
MLHLILCQKLGTTSRLVTVALAPYFDICDLGQYLCSQEIMRCIPILYIGTWMPNFGSYVNAERAALEKFPNEAGCIHENRS